MTTLPDECRERATYLKAMEPEGLSTIERQCMETLFKAADELVVTQKGMEAAARIVDEHAAKHARLQREADKRRPPRKDAKPWERTYEGWPPGYMAMTHGGLSKIYSDLAEEIRALALARREAA